MIVYRSMKRILFFFAALAAAFSAAGQGVPCTMPPALQPGDTVVILSPAYHSDPKWKPKTEEILCRWGYVPLFGQYVDSLYAGAYAGTDAQRAEDLLRALNDPSVKAVICQRGGYGTIRLAGMIPPEAFAAHPKWLVGFSDITTLHSLSVCAGVASIHGPGGSSIASADGEDEDSQVLREMLRGYLPLYEVPAHECNVPGRAHGRLVGGNLCTFAALAGTPYDFLTSADDLILFIEETEESYHAIDRYFQMLRVHGVLEHVRGVILGRFNDCGADLDYPSVEAMLTAYFRPLGIPVCCGFPAGHGGPNAPLLMGADVTLDVTSESAVLLFH